VCRQASRSSSCSGSGPADSSSNHSPPTTPTTSSQASHLSQAVVTSACVCCAWGLLRFEGRAKKMQQLRSFTLHQQPIASSCAFNTAASGTPEQPKRCWWLLQHVTQWGGDLQDSSKADSTVQFIYYFQNGLRHVREATTNFSCFACKQTCKGLLVSYITHTQRQLGHSLKWTRVAACLLPCGQCMQAACLLSATDTEWHLTTCNRHEHAACHSLLAK